MSIQQLDLGRGIDWNPLATMASLQAATQQKQDAAAESKQRLTEGQLNLQKLQLALDQSRKDQAENDQIKARIAKGGPPEEVYKDLVPINPDKARAYLTNAQADTLQQQQQADQRFRDLQGSVAPGADVATPQTTTAPIQASLTDPSQMSQQVSEPGTARAEVPLPSVTKHYIGQPDTVLQPQSRNQLTLAEQARQAFLARLEVQKKNAEITVIPKDAEAFQNGAVIASNVKKEPSKVNFSNDGIPYSVTGPDKTEYVIGDSKMPPELKREADAAVASHAQRIKEKIDQEDRLNANASARADENNRRQTERQTGVPDPRLANVPAANQKDVLDKVHGVEKAYSAAQRAADDFAGFITGAKAGNKVAAQYSPVEGVLQINAGAGVKRVNRQEIEQFAGAGSLWDRIAGWAGKQVEGQPVPKNILNDMQNLNEILAGNAKAQYQRDLQSIDRTYRSNFAGTSDPAAVSPPSGNPFR